MSRDAAMTMITGAPAVATVGPEIPTAPVETPKTEMDSARFASVARKEQEFVKNQLQLKKDRETFLAEKAKSDEVLKKAQLFEDTRKTDPVAALRLIGFNETEIFNYLAAQEKKELTPEEKAAEAAANAAQEKIDAFEKSQKDKELQAVATRDAKLIEGFKTQMSQIIEGDKDKYEYCNYYGPSAISLAYDTVLQIVKDSNGTDIPTAQEAMDMIEELYEEQDKAMNALKKRQPKEAAPIEKQETERTRTVTPPVGGTPQRPTINHTRTVTNAATATAAGAASRRQETREQKKERLMEALRTGKL